MSHSTLTRRQLRRRFVACSVALLTLVGVTSAISITTGYTQKSASAYGRGYSYPTPAPPTEAEQVATLEATDAYRRTVELATQNFAAATSTLVGDIDAGRLPAARHDEQRAQSAYDVFRVDGGSSVSALLPMDTLMADENPALPPSGLHAVEEGLWTGKLAMARAAATSLESLAPELEYGLLRTIITPAQICARLDEQVGWTVESVIDTPQEVFSRDDNLDVTSVVATLAAALPSIERLGMLVSPKATAPLAGEMADLTAIVRAVPAGASDQQIAAQTWRHEATVMDHLEATLGNLSGVLADFGTGRNYA